MKKLSETSNIKNKKKNVDINKDNKKDVKENSHGFTLIELLVTIAILSVVVSICIYFAYDIVNGANKKSYQVTISNIEKEAGTYALENVASVGWRDVNGFGESTYQYQCITVDNLIDTGYFSGDVLNSKIDKDTTVKGDNVVYLERDINSKVITNSVLLVGNRTGYVGLCDNLSENTTGNITYTVVPSGWQTEKTITVNYEISENVVDVSEYTYEYTYILDKDKSEALAITENFRNRKRQEVITVDKNGTLYPKIKDSNGNEKSGLIIDVSKIDNDAPSIDISSQGDVSSTPSVKLTMNDHGGSGVAGYYVGMVPPSENSWVGVSGKEDSEDDVVATTEINWDSENTSWNDTWYLYVKDVINNQNDGEKVTLRKTELVIDESKIVSGSIPSYVITLDGEIFEIPVPDVKDGYYFVGWYTNSNYTGEPITEYTPTASGTLYGKIVKKITVPTTITYCSKTKLTYNGKEQTLTENPGDGYTFVNNTGTNAGKYTVTAKLTGDYVWDDTDDIRGIRTFDCEIAKASISPTVSISNYTYAGTKNNPSISGNSGNGTVTYYYNTSNNNSGGTAWSNVANATSLDAGTYYMYATVGETTNYEAATTVTTSFKVNKASCSCEIGSVPTTMKYPSAATGNITYACGGDGRTISVTSGTTDVITAGTVGTNTTTLTAVGVGSSTITVSMSSGTNYNACTSDSENVTVSASIYTIGYEYNNGTKGSNAPTSATYGNVVTIDNPSKTVTVTGNANGTGATIGAATSGGQTFAGWTYSGGSTSTAKYGTSSTSVTTSWSTETTKVKAQYFKNLRTTSGTVTLTANWTPVAFKLPTVTKSGYTCTWNTQANGNGTSYSSGASYTPSANGSTAITMYAICTPNVTNINAKRYNCSIYDGVYRLTVYYVTTCSSGVCNYSSIHGLDKSLYGLAGTGTFGAYGDDKNYTTMLTGAPTWSVGETNLSTEIDKNCQKKMYAKKAVNCRPGAHPDSGDIKASYTKDCKEILTYNTTASYSTGYYYYYVADSDCYLLGAFLSSNNPCSSSSSSSTSGSSSCPLGGTKGYISGKYQTYVCDISVVTVKSASFSVGDYVDRIDKCEQYLTEMGKYNADLYDSFMDLWGYGTCAYEAS